MPQPYIDLILLSYNKFSSTTKPCLESLLPDSKNANYRITVIDNCSPDGSGLAIKEYLKNEPQIRTVSLDTNTGFAGGMNYGVNISDAEWVLLVNSDTVFYPGALDVLFNAMKSAPANVGMIGPITNAAGNGQSYPLSGSCEEVFKQARTLHDTPCQALIPCYRLDFYCVGIRRALWNELNGLDPIFGLGYYEDTDFSMRAKAVGCEMMICEDAVVYHQGGSSFSNNPTAKALIKCNKKIFIKRHPQAILYHSREGNFQAIEEYLKHLKTGNWNEGFEFRMQLRKKALLESMPRSLIKRWLWKYKVNKLLLEFEHMARHRVG